MSTRHWRTLLLSVCAFAIAVTAYDFSELYTLPFASTGLGIVSAGKPYLQKVSAVTPGLGAAKSGLRPGDVLDTRPMSVPDRYRLYNLKYNGQSIRVYVVGPAGLTPRTIDATTPRQPQPFDVWLAFAGIIWMALFAGLLAIRRPESRHVRILVLILAGFVVEANLRPNNWVTPWAGVDAVAQSVSWLMPIALALLATYSLSFARPASLRRRALLWISYAVACSISAFAISQIIAQCTGVFDPSSPVFTSPWTFFATWALQFVFPLLCGIATAFETRGAERTRFLWAFVPIALFYSTQCFTWTVGAFFQQYYLPSHIVSNAAMFLAPLGLMYALFNRRLLDIGFALNRAAIFSVVSLVLVGTFVLVEWLLTDWLQLEGHSANIAISGALALGLGLSMRFVHGKAEHFVDHVMFRKRREDEEAIRRMAREAPYITSGATLLTRAEHVLLQHADASSVNVLLDNGSGFYGTVNENDLALVALRTEHARVDLHALETSISGEWAYPMVARGRLVGALVIGPKRSQESYAPDESAAIAQLAHSLASALDVLGTRADSSNVNATLERIVSMLERLTPEVL